jgi:hypothetical protein
MNNDFLATSCLNEMRNGVTCFFTGVFDLLGMAWGLISDSPVR